MDSNYDGHCHVAANGEFDMGCRAALTLPGAGRKCGAAPEGEIKRNNGRPHARTIGEGWPRQRARQVGRPFHHKSVRAMLDD
jgi:hypothetical protein